MCSKAASSSSVFENPSDLFVGSRAAPPQPAPAAEAINSDAFVDEKKKELVPIGPVPKRPLAATLSDPDAKRGGTKMKNAKQIQGWGHWTRLGAKTKRQKTIQKVMEEYGSARKHVAKQIVAVCTKLPGPPQHYA